MRGDGKAVSKVIKAQTLFIFQPAKFVLPIMLQVYVCGVHSQKPKAKSQ